jgi:hypothetical protein
LAVGSEMLLATMDRWRHCHWFPRKSEDRITLSAACVSCTYAAISSPKSRPRLVPMLDPSLITNTSMRRYRDASIVIHTQRQLACCILQISKGGIPNHACVPWVQVHVHALLSQTEKWKNTCYYEKNESKYYHYSIYVPPKWLSSWNVWIKSLTPKRTVFIVPS